MGAEPVAALRPVVERLKVSHDLESRQRPAAFFAIEEHYEALHSTALRAALSEQYEEARPALGARLQAGAAQSGAATSPLPLRKRPRCEDGSAAASAPLKGSRHGKGPPPRRAGPRRIGGELRLRLEPLPQRRQEGQLADL